MNQKMRCLKDIDLQERRNQWVEKWEMLLICMSLQCRIVDKDSCDRFDQIYQMIVFDPFEEDLWVFKAKFLETKCFQDCHQTGKHQVFDLMIEKVLKTDENLRVLFKFWMKKPMKVLFTRIESLEDDFSHLKMNDILHEY